MATTTERQLALWLLDTGGRRQAQALNTLRKVQIAQALYHGKSNAIADICRTLRISRATLYRYVKTGPAQPTPSWHASTTLRGNLLAREDMDRQRQEHALRL